VKIPLLRARRPRTVTIKGTSWNTGSRAHLEGQPLTVNRIGVPRDRYGDVYHHLLTASWPQVIAILLAGYLLLNAVFAVFYVAIDGIEFPDQRLNRFADAFFFSVQTLATIGYGHMLPKGLAGNILVTIEAVLGLLGFSVGAGLMFAKFSRPTARILFSRVALMTRYEGADCLMFRMGNVRTNMIATANLGVILLTMETTAEGVPIRRMLDLKLMRAHSTVFSLTWVAIHIIDESSPLYGATPDSLKARDALVVASLTGLDETFLQTIHARHAYGPDEIIWNAQFVDVVSALPDGTRVIDYGRFHDVRPAPWLAETDSAAAKSLSSPS
jgi:inward rectifier potassium channel